MSEQELINKVNKLTELAEAAEERRNTRNGIIGFVSLYLTIFLILYIDVSLIMAVLK